MPTKKIYKVALIGASGFIAKNIIKILQQNNISVLCIGRNKPTNIKSEDFFKYDLTDSSSNFNSAFEVETVIFNSALKGRFTETSYEWAIQGQISAPNFEHLFKHLNLKTDRLITIGSSEEYGPQLSDTPIKENFELKPVSSYGFWKSFLYQQGLSWKQKKSSQFVHLRPFNVYGDGLDQKMFLGSIITTLLQNETFHMTKGEQFRSFVPVDVLVETILKFIELKNWNGYHNKNALNVSTAYYYQLSDVARFVRKKIRKGRLKIGSVPYRTDEVWHQKPNLDVLDRLNLDSSKSSFEVGLQRVINTYQARVQPQALQDALT
ncbi:hypothetical protein CIK05_00295 [Bdellovibrio sp. qaytius]|nr:hypothetical protein CIK05_00295 [Bdellovibrio sp. qaytius]